MKLKRIGVVGQDERGLFIAIDEDYRSALIGLEGFSHIQVLWWADQVDDPEMRRICTLDKPYTNGPDCLGIYATRSPMRPNPIALSLISVIDVDVDKGVIRTTYIDSAIETPIVDIKPYLPCQDRPLESTAPSWSAMLPKSLEESADYDWQSYFNF